MFFVVVVDVSLDELQDGEMEAHLLVVGFRHFLHLAVHRLPDFRPVLFTRHILLTLEDLKLPELLCDGKCDKFEFGADHSPKHFVLLGFAIDFFLGELRPGIVLRYLAIEIHILRQVRQFPIRNEDILFGLEVMHFLHLLIDGVLFVEARTQMIGHLIFELFVGVEKWRGLRNRALFLQQKIAHFYHLVDAVIFLYRWIIRTEHQPEQHEDPPDVVPRQHQLQQSHQIALIDQLNILENLLDHVVDRTYCINQILQISLMLGGSPLEETVIFVIFGYPIKPVLLGS